ncbi:hypothetical protein [Stenotrophomonas phage vB_SmeS_BUCT700]|uniref:Uncharacterized protein n=1 Tax=Stenotrophomonas phage vB_SmeS_BUCT700 TaxID=2924895 RepID=A0AAE9G6G8_9CAUD|nr:hypothetical protein [Stenotrophomonas phage vB_SmeS_BUCT700]UNY50306.1 hypothetical protein [Stenotrophomonas phage vB_SmeS_BUCT703]
MSADCVATLSLADIEIVQGWWDATCLRMEEYGLGDDPEDIALANRLGLTTLPQDERL